VARSLRGVAASVKTLELPVGKDLSKWIAAGGTREQLAALIETASDPRSNAALGDRRPDPEPLDAPLGTQPPPLETEPVSGAQIVADVERFVRRYLVLPGKAYLPVAIWIIATYAAPLFDCFPYIAALSPQKRCGKTRLFEVLEALAYHPWLGTAPTAAALYRMLENAPTLLVDEVEIFSGKNKSVVDDPVLQAADTGRQSRRVAVSQLTQPASEAHLVESAVLAFYRGDASRNRAVLIDK
jgi:hypothetical protein